MKNGLNAFLSEGAIREHREHLCDLKLRASIYTKSGIDVKKIAENAGAGVYISREEREKIKKLYRDIKMHEIYFESFGGSFVPCPKIKERFGSENNFAYLFEKLAREANGEFICLYSDRAERLGFCECTSLPRDVRVHLALDLCEHAYFRDYGFKREDYIRAALAHFDFGKINSMFISENEK